MGDSYKLIKENIEWINTYEDKMNDRIKTLLNSGFLYVYGRDMRFRPLLIVELKKVNELIDKKYSFDEVNDVIIYVVKYIITYLFIPGQIEKIIITDFDDVGVGSIGTFKKVLGTLNRYRGRVYKNFMLNLGSFLGTMVEKAVNVFSSQSAKKMKILNKEEFKEMFKFIRPDNIQRKYGGTATNVNPGGNNLFPPNFPAKTFYTDNIKPKLKTIDEYKEMCNNSKPFKPFTINEEMIKKFAEEEEKIRQKKEKMKEEKERITKEKEERANQERERLANRTKNLKEMGIDVRSFAITFNNLRTSLKGGNKKIPVAKTLDVSVFGNFFKKNFENKGITILK